MLLNIAKHESNVIENGVYYFSPSDYPDISEYELRNLVAFVEYKKKYNRQTKILCKDKTILALVNDTIANPERIIGKPLPEKISGCTACLQHGCLTQYVYHATDIEAAAKILSSGKLLSKTKVSGKTADELAYEKRDSLWNDPADFFEYIMFCWGNCVVGDYVIMSDAPNSEFSPGVRFYFRYKSLLQHPGHMFDGFHCIKVKEEIVLSDYLHACIVPAHYRDELKSVLYPEFASKVFFTAQDGLEIPEWSTKVYEFINKLE